MNTVESRGESHGFVWECVAMDLGHRCGYVQIPDGHPLYGLSFCDKAPGFELADVADEPAGKRGILSLLLSRVGDDNSITLDVLFNVHGSLTFGGSRYSNTDWWLGFDCGHYGDAPDLAIMSDQHREIEGRWASRVGVIHTQEYVEAECIALAEQIAQRFPIAEEDKIR